MAANSASPAAAKWLNLLEPDSGTADAFAVGVTQARIIAPGATTMITKRATLRKGFLAPWHPDVNRIWWYALASAQQRCEVAIHTASLPVNHHHLGATPTHANLPEFVGQVHGDMSKALNTLLAREKYDAPHELWDKRQPHYMRLMDAAAQVTGMSYIQLNCVAAGLVARPEHMPGQRFHYDLWKTRYIEVKRPDVYFDDSRPERLMLEVTPPPLLYEAFDGDIDALVAHMKALEREQIQRLRANQKRGPLGAQRLMRLHPWSEPRTLRESGGRPVPTFRYGARGIVRVQLEFAGAREVNRFHRHHGQTRLVRRDGDLTAVFPFGTYKERVVHGAPVAGVPEEGNAAIAMPGPTLADIEARLAAKRKAEGPKAPHAVDAIAVRIAALMDEAGSALQDEAEELCAQAKDDVGELRHGAASRDSDRNVLVRHRFDCAQPTAGSGIARVITHRDRRRGRPAASRNRYATDPPA